MRSYYLLKGRLGWDTSQYGEVNLLKQLVRDDFPPFLVDVGAYDGVVYSDSLPFVRKGWNALLVEPNPRVFDLLARTHRGNPRVRCVNLACSDRPGTLPFFIGNDGDTGMTSTLCTDDNELFNARRSGRTIDVKVETLTSLLTQNEVPRDFSLLFVDAEGMDYEVLAGLDLKLFRPRIVISEDYPLNKQKHADKYRMLTGGGYLLHGMLGCNSVWVRSP